MARNEPKRFFRAILLLITPFKTIASKESVNMLQHKASDRFLAIRQNLNGLSTTEIDVWVHAIVDDNKKRQDYNIAVEGVTYETRIHIARSEEHTSELQSPMY